MDGVTGASVTSAAILSAVADAVEQAGGDVKALQAVDLSQEPVDEEFSYDIVVAGGGIAGLAAAIKAKELGANVAVVEKQGFTGGTTCVSAGAVFVTTDDSDETAQAFADYWCGDYIVNPSEDLPDHELIARSAKRSKEFQDILNRAGLEYTIWEGPVRWLMADPLEKAVQNMEHIATITTPSLVKNPKSGSSLMAALGRYAREVGVDIYLNTPATNLIVRDDGSVEGVVCATDRGTKTFRAGAVILATGDYLRNKDLCKQYCMDSYYNYPATNTGNTGDGLVMALEAGAVMDDNQHFMGGTYIFDPYDMAISQGGGNYPNESLVLNRDGVRVCSETIPPHDYQFYFGSTEHAASAWAVMGKAQAQLVPLMDSYLSRTEAGDEIVQVYKADTLEELAEHMGVDAETLIDSVNSYNALCEQGEDTQFGKDPSLLVAIEPPYYAGLGYDSGRGNYGGVVTDEHKAVVDADGNVIPGLYGVGAVSSGRYYNDYYPGGSLALYATVGLIAAEDAVARLGK